MKTYPLHPICNIFPPLPEEELEELVADIQANGLLDPIVLYQGAVLDGRNRQEACLRAKVPLRTVEWEDPGDGPTAWAVAKNMKRRHLDAGQRTICAVKAKPFFEADAAARRAQTQFGSPGQRISTLTGDAGVSRFPEGEPVVRGKAAEQAAAAFGASETYVEKADRLKREFPEEFAAVERGEKKLAAALRETQFRRENPEEYAAVERGEKTFDEVVQEVRRRDMPLTQALRESRNDQHSADRSRGKPPEDTIDALLASMQSAAIGLMGHIDRIGGVESLRAFLREPLPYREIQEMREDTLEGWDLVEIVASQVRSALED